MEPPIKQSLGKRLLRLGQESIDQFGTDRTGRMGAALAFYTLFALIPLMFVGVAVVGLLLRRPELLETIMTQVEEVAGAVVADTIGGILEDVERNAPASLAIGAVLAAFTASSLFIQVRSALDDIFRAPDPKVTGPLGVILQRVVGLLAMMVFGILILAPIAAVASVQFIDRFVPDGLGWVRTFLPLAVPLTSALLLTAAVALSFMFLSRAEIPWRAARRGAIFTSVVGLLGAFGIGRYLNTSVGGEENGLSVNALGVIGGVAILLFFFNLVWQIYLFGAHVTKVYADYLIHGDIIGPKRREKVSRDAHLRAGTSPYAPGRKVEEAKIGAMALIAGIVIGWWRRRS